MPYAVNWLIPNEIIYSHYSGIVTAAELHECLVRMYDMIESSPRHLVHMISNLGDIVEGVPLLESIQIVRNVGAHPRAGWTISLREESILMRMGASIGTSIFRMRFTTASTLDRAYAHLQDVDAALSWDQLDKTVIEQSMGARES